MGSGSSPIVSAEAFVTLEGLALQQQFSLSGQGSDLSRLKSELPLKARTVESYLQASALLFTFGDVVSQSPFSDSLAHLSGSTGDQTRPVIEDRRAIFDVNDMHLRDHSV